MTNSRYPAAKTVKWTVAEAKARFSEVLDRAQKSGPQIVTRSGRDAVVVVSIDEWQRKTKRRGSLADFFSASPLRDSALDVRRSRTALRDVDL